MIEIKRLEKYDEKLAADMGKLLLQLSSKWDGSPISREWIENVVKSPWHDELLAFDENGKLVGMASMSVLLGAKIIQNAYLEDFVIDSEYRRHGVGRQMWNAMLEWGREKKCKRLEFTSSGNEAKDGAVQFYLKMGAGIHKTNFFRIEL